MERRSCCSVLMFILLATVCVGLVAYMRIQVDLTNKLTAEIKLLKTARKQVDMSSNQFDLELKQLRQLEDTTKKEVEELQNEVKQFDSDQVEIAKEVEECKNSVDLFNKDIAVVEKDKSDIEGNFSALTLKWSEVTKDLKKKLQEHSPVCAYVKKDSDANGQCPKTASKTIIKEGQKKS